MIKAFIFDFDGLIMDTETPEFEAWQEVFRQYNQQLPLSEWQKALGTSRDEFDPPTYLEELVGHPVNKKKVEHDQKVLSMYKIMRLNPLAGVENLIKSAFDHGIKLAVASNSSADWVWCNLARLDLARYFDTICTGDEVASVKPEPDLYLLALKELQIYPHEAIAFEDSPNGISGAHNAGIFCVAIPNRISSQLNIDHADLILSSLSKASIDNLMSMTIPTRER